MRPQARYTGSTPHGKRYDAGTRFSEQAQRIQSCTGRLLMRAAGSWRKQRIPSWGRNVQDPEAKKPEDWDERPRIDDPEDKKPDDWDDVPKTIPDAEAKKPDEWDEEDDGVWEPPSTPNPEYKGEWQPKTIENPEYKVRALAGRFEPALRSALLRYAALAAAGAGGARLRAAAAWWLGRRSFARPPEGPP